MIIQNVQAFEFTTLKLITVFLSTEYKFKANDSDTCEIARVRVIVRYRYKWSRAVVNVLPVNFLKQRVLFQRYKHKTKLRSS